MEALKAIGSLLGLLMGFALVIGIVIAVVVAGFYVGLALLGLFVILFIFYGILECFKSK